MGSIGGRLMSSMMGGGWETGGKVPKSCREGEGVDIMEDGRLRSAIRLKKNYTL